MSVGSGGRVDVGGGGGLLETFPSLLAPRHLSGQTNGRLDVEMTKRWTECI